MKSVNMENFIQEITELKTEMKYISKTLVKMEKVLENNILLEKRIKDLEDKDTEKSKKIRKLEDWQIKIIAIASVVATIGSTAVGIMIKLFI